MDEQKNFSPNTDGVYRTGGETQPKSGGAVLPVALMCVILFIGVIRLCGGLQGNVLRQLENLAQDEPIVFSSSGPSQQVTPSQESSADFSALGFSGRAVSHLWQAYYRLPAGLFITDVSRPSDAASKGIAGGDILVRFQGQPVTDPQSLNTLLQNHRSGDVVEVIIYRNGQQYAFPLTLR